MLPLTLMDRVLIRRIHVQLNTHPADQLGLFSTSRARFFNKIPDGYITHKGNREERTLTVREKAGEEELCSLSFGSLP